MSASRSLAFVGILALLATASCSNSSTAPGGGGGVGGGTCSGTNASVAVCDNHYSPIASTIAHGSSITWTWKGSNSHSVTFTSGTLSGTSSSTMSAGTYTLAFPDTGTFNYECNVHGPSMSGTVVVN